MPALRAAVAQAGPPARLVRRVVLEVALAGGPPADGAGAGGVPDLGQVPEPDPGIVAPGFVPVLAVVGVQGVDRDDQVRPAAGDAQPPGAVSAGRPVPAGRGEAEPGPAGGGPGPARFLWLVGSGRAQPWPTACPCSSVTVTHHVVFGFRAAAVTRSRASHGSTGPSPASSPGPVRQAGRGAQRHGQRDPPGEPARRRAARTRARGGTCAGSAILAPSRAP